MLFKFAPLLAHNSLAYEACFSEVLEYIHMFDPLIHKDVSPIQRKFNFTTFFVKVQLGQSLHNHTIFMFPIVNDLCMQKHGPTEGIRTLQD